MTGYDGQVPAQPAGEKVTLHDYWRSSASYRVRIALALKNISYKRVSVDLTAGDQRSSEYRQLNPQGLVPILLIDGLVLTQSLTIIEYLDETRTGHPLLPQDRAARARVRAIALAIACETHPLSNLSVLKRVENMAGKAASEQWNRENLTSGLDNIERLLDHSDFTGQFCHGNLPCIADCALIPQLYNATRWGVSFDHLERITAVARSCAKIPAFVDTYPKNPASA